MEISRELLQEKLQRWEQYMLQFELPRWEQLPDLELYMDQVVALVTRCMDALPVANPGDAVITPSTVNNYVRLKVMPAPVRKKYTRIHLAYLILICLLKQSLSLAEIQLILPYDLPEDQVRAVYDNFGQLIHDTSRLFIVQVKEAAQRASEEEQGNLMLTSAVCAMLYRLLTTKLLTLRAAPEPEEK